MNVDTVPRTLAVAAIVALLCSAMVSGAVHLLRPIQQGYAMLDRNRTILEAAGRLPEGDLSDLDIVDRYLDLEARVVDLGTGDYLPNVDAHAFNHWTPPESDEAPQPDDTTAPATQVPIYIVRRDDKLQRIVLPVHGAGMWSTIYGYVTLDSDLSTVNDLVIYRHAETPGIGDRIEAPAWRAKWRGKRIYDNDGNVRIQVVRDASDEFGVDLISGASVTADAVGSLVRHWFGDDGYRPYLERLRQREGL
jgi:Na+-transporting NADH:ubiquinone oxidoreductase subunit C